MKNTKTNTLKLHQLCPLPDGLGFRLETFDNLPVLATDKVLLDQYEGLTKRKIGVSLCSGCSVGCLYCFTRQYSHFRPLRVEEITEQVSIVLANSTHRQRFDQIKISFKQMGDPLVNPVNTLGALQKLHHDFPNFQLVVSTSGPKINLDFFPQIQEFARASCNLRLQFSCHTTSDWERKRLSPRMPMLSLREIATIANQWSGNLVTLNFVILKGYKYSPRKIAQLFDPAKVLIKINYLDPHRGTQKQGLADAETTKVNNFSQALKKKGFQLAFRHSPTQ